MKIKVYRNFSETLIKTWKSLENENYHSIFQSCFWLKHWYECIGKKQKYTLNIIQIEDNNSNKIIIPFTIKNFFGTKVLTFLGGNQTDYNSVIYSKKFEYRKNVNYWSKIKKYLDYFDVVELHNLKNFNDYQSLFPKNNFNLSNSEISHFSLLENTWENQKLKLRKKTIQDTARQIKRLKSLGRLKFEIIDKKNIDYEKLMNIFFKQKEKRYINTGVHNNFNNIYIKNFYKNIVNPLNSESFIQFSVLKINDQIIATHWGAYNKNTFYYLMPTFSIEWEKYSPGKILLEYLIKWSIDQKIVAFDFTIGSEGYKKQWCDQELKLNELSFPINNIGNLYLKIKKLRKTLKKSNVIVKLLRNFRKIKTKLTLNE